MAYRMMKRFYLSFLTLAFSACSAVTPPCPIPVKSDIVYVVSQGWHAEIGIPVEELSPKLAFYRKVFPGARVIMFGYGKKTFFTAPPQTFSEYVLGPFPGTAVIHAVGLRVAADKAYPPEATVTLMLPADGKQALSAYIWNDLSKDAAGKPQIVAPSTHPDGLFYAANSRYNLLHTCNSWTADALHAAGLPVSTSAVMFSGQVMNRVKKAAQNQCRSLR
jgi:uncharacterized protein (TIGR02117 family)